MHELAVELAAGLEFELAAPTGVGSVEAKADEREQ